MLFRSTETQYLGNFNGFLEQNNALKKLKLDVIFLFVCFVHQKVMIFASLRQFCRENLKAFIGQGLGANTTLKKLVLEVTEAEIRVQNIN